MPIIFTYMIFEKIGVRENLDNILTNMKLKLNLLIRIGVWHNDLYSMSPLHVHITLESYTE